MNKKMVSLDSIQYLSFLSKDCSKLSAQIAAITLSKRFPQLINMIVLLLEYLQLLSQGVLLGSTFDQDEIINGNSVSQAIVYVAKIVDPGSWLNFEQQTLLANIIFAVFATLIIFKSFIFAYIVLIVKLNKRGFSLLLILWSWIFKIQGRITCFFITSFFFKIIIASTSQDNFDSFGIGKINLVIISAAMVLFEYAFSFYLQFVFCCVLPSKDFLASKNNQIEILTLAQKLVIQILQTVLVTGMLSTCWIFSISNLLLSIARETYFFSSLPLYSWKALSYQAGLSMIVTSLNFSYFSKVVIQSIGYDGQLNFIVVLWMILAILFIKISQGYLRHEVIVSLINSNKGSPEYLIHRIGVIKHLRKQNKVPGDMNEKYEVSYVLNAAIEACVKTIFLLNPGAPKEITSKIDSKQNLNQLFLHYLESLLIKYPNNGLIKLYSAYIYAQKLQQYSAAIKLISNIQQSPSEKIKLNASILIYQMQKRIAVQNQNKNINLSKYIENITQVAKLKVKMLEQAEVQSKVFEEILGEAPNLQNIFNYGQVVDRYISNIRAEIKKTLDMRPDNYVEPLLLCAHYSLELNHCMTNYMNYIKNYSFKSKKYESYFRSDKLREENLYQEGNVFIMTSGQKADAGKILYCSKSIEKVYGNNPKSYIGTTLSSLTPPSLQSFYTSFFKVLVDTGDKSLIRNVVRGFGYHSKGYLVQADYYIDFHPFMTQNFCFNVIVRPVPSSKDYLLLLENGDIECASEKIINRLSIPYRSSLTTSLTNIRSVSEELSQVNFAFNMIALPDKYYSNGNGEIQSESSLKSREATRKRISIKNNESYSNKPKMSKERAEELYSIFTNSGTSLKLRALQGKDSSNIHPYLCKVENVFYGSLLIKVVTLEEDLDDLEEDSQGNLCIRRNEPKEIINKSENTVVWSENHELRKKSEHTESEESIPPDENFAEFNNLRTFDNVRVFSTASPLYGRESLATMQLERIVSTDEKLVSRSDTKAIAFLKTQVDDQAKQISKLPTGVVQESSKTKTKTKTKSKSEISRGRSFRVERSVAESYWSKISTREKISNAVKAALAVKYYPRYVKGLFILFYISLVGIFINQIFLKYTLDNTLSLIRTSKDIIGKAEMRNYLLVNVQQSSRFLWDLGNGKFKSTGVRLYVNTPFYVSLVNRYLTNLSDTNEDLFKSINSLDTETKRSLLMKDVRIYDTYFDEPVQVYDTFDNFQATSRILEIGLRGVNVMLKNLTQGKEVINFLLRNSVNDLLLKNEMTSNVLMESLSWRQNDISNTMRICLILSISCFIAFNMGFIGAVWKQFQTEKINMLAVIKLDSQQIKIALDKINQFKKIIIEEKHFEDNQNVVLLQTAKSPVTSYAKEKDKKKESMRRPNITGIWKKYTTYIFILLLFMTGLTVLSTWYFFINGNSLDFSQNKQNQFFFINRLKTQLSLCVTIAQELFATNGTALTHNNLNTQEYPNAVQTLIKMNNDITKILMNDDLGYHPQVQDVLFNDGCAYVEKNWAFYCSTLKSLGKKTGFMFVLTDLISLLVEARESYEVSNKTTQSLTLLEAQCFANFAAPYYVAAAECDVVSNVISQILENDISTMLSSRNLYFGIFVSFFILLSILVWILTINPLRRANVRFKKILQAFPPNLILSSFLLKSFLMNTSNDALNSIKNQI